jgi:hypothetical protein
LASNEATLTLDESFAELVLVPALLVPPLELQALAMRAIPQNSMQIRKRFLKCPRLANFIVFSFFSRRSTGAAGRASEVVWLGADIPGAPCYSSVLSTVFSV